MKPRPQSKRYRRDDLNTGRRNAREQAEQYFTQGKQQQSNNKYLQALDCYLKATICDSNYFQAYCNMGSCFRLLGKYKQAKSSYKRSIGICKEDAISNYNLANLERIIGNFTESIKYYRIVIDQHEK